MKYLVAVSGGVDSVVLLDMMVKKYGKTAVCVGHFDHGIRGEASAADARFVQRLCEQKYNIRCNIGYGDLGRAASEAAARSARYTFLRALAKDNNACIMTAHHQDDLIETIALNIQRGTGWRGLAVMGDQTIERPLLSMPKQALYHYALLHELEWVEDETNQTNIYARNRIRRQLAAIGGHVREQLLALYNRQLHLRTEINSELDRYHDRLSSRSMIGEMPDVVALELLREATDARLTRPQRQRLLRAIRTLQSGKVFQPGDGMEVVMHKDEFIVKNTSRVL